MNCRHVLSGIPQNKSVGFHVDDSEVFDSDLRRDSVFGRNRDFSESDDDSSEEINSDLAFLRKNSVFLRKEESVNLEALAESRRASFSDLSELDDIQYIA